MATWDMGCGHFDAYGDPNHDCSRWGEEWTVDYSSPEYDPDNYTNARCYDDPECDGCCASDTRPCHRGGCDMCDPLDFETMLMFDYPEYDPDYAFYQSEGRPRFPNEY